MTNSDLQQRFLDLLDEHRKIVHKVAGTYARTAADRADLEQEIIAQLWRSFPRYDEQYRYSTWMYRIALNVAISWFRSESRRQRTHVADEDFMLRVPAEPHAEPDERLQQLRGLIERLGEVDRALLILYLDGHRYSAIAEIVGLSETNVGSRISRIKQRFRREFADAT